MTKISYYLLAHQEIAQQRLFACRLIEKAYSLGHTIYIHTDNSEQTSQLDQLLWSYSAESFIPHSTERALIQVSHHNDPGEHHDQLINLGASVPEFFSRFNKVSEIVCQHEQMVKHSRDKWKFYQDRGYPLQSHKIAPSTTQ